MRFIIYFLLVFVSSGLLASPSADTCKCGDTKGTGHKREALKYRSIPPHIHAERDVSIQEMIDEWAIPQGAWDDATKYPREDSTFTVSGYIMLIKLSDEDCDIHMEIAETESPDADRVIVEIPNSPEYCALREKVKEAVRQEPYSVRNISTTAHHFSATKGFPKITVTGYAFVDLPHRMHDPNNKKGNNHGSVNVATLWEIHPIISCDVK
jgi:hypothetical protein